MANQIINDKIEIQRQQAVQNTIDAKVEAHQALTDSDIEFICPVAFKQTLSENEKAKYGARYLVYGLEKQLDILEEVLKRVEAQQELIDLKQNSISLN